MINIAKIVRFGISRAHFSKFYKIEDKLLLGNLSKIPLPINFESFEKVAS